VNINYGKLQLTITNSLFISKHAKEPTLESK